MKRIVVALVLLSAAPLSAGERTYKPHSKVNDPTLVMQLRQEMAHLENGFLQIEENYKAEGVDYDRILKAIEQMEATRRTIQKVVANREWAPPLKDLSVQLEKIRKSASRHDPVALRKDVDGMYDACFRCHAANAPKDY